MACRSRWSQCVQCQCLLDLVGVTCKLIKEINADKTNSNHRMHAEENFEAGCISGSCRGHLASSNGGHSQICGDCPSLDSDTCQSDQQLPSDNRLENDASLFGDGIVEKLEPNGARAMDLQSSEAVGSEPTLKNLMSRLSLT